MVYGLLGPCGERFGDQGRIVTAAVAEALPQACIYWCVEGGPWQPFPDRLAKADRLRARLEAERVEKWARKHKRRAFVAKKAAEQGKSLEQLEAELAEQGHGEE
jgi:hypothetical protein